MSFVYEALKKAEREGKIDSTWTPVVEKESQEERKPPAVKKSQKDSKPPAPKKSKVEKQPPAIDELQAEIEPRLDQKPPVVKESDTKQPPPAQRPAQKLPFEIADNFTTLTQNVQLAHTEKGVSVIAITSSVPGEGCSTITYYLSLLLAQTVHNHPRPRTWDEIKGANKNDGALPEKAGVLVIDGNLKTPNLYRLFGVHQQHGVNEFIVTDDGNQPHVTPNHFNFITSGKINGNWHDVWASERTRQLIEKLRSQFEYILIDAPPVIGHPDTLALSKLTDGVLFVVKANQTRLEVVEEARQRLQEAKVNVLGAVLNERRFFIPGGIYRRI